jgi:hypothetical protein
MVCFVYYYRNQFISLDTSLTIQYRENTIDTVSRVKIRTATLQKDNTKVLAAPPIMVNRLSATANGWLFINSNALAKNEHPNAHKQADIIDVYSLIDRKYVFSFYVPAYLRKYRMKEFTVSKNTLTVHYGNAIRLFSLRDKYFQH